MKTLILIRHGEAEPAYTTSDFNRKLTVEGQTTAKGLGRKLNAINIAPEIIISSNAMRTKQTTEALLSQLNDTCGVQYSDSLYNANPTMIRSHIEDQSRHFNTIVIVGHNPGISILAGELSGQLISFKSGEGIALELELEEWGLIAGTATKEFHYL